MRVKGNVSPSVLSVEEYASIPGKAEVKIRENISEQIIIDPMSEEEITVYEYDEYTFILDNTKGLKKEIEKNLEDWLITGKTLEVSPQATLYVTAKSDAIDEYTEELIEEGLL